MVFQLDFKRSYGNIRMRPGNTFVVCDLCGLFLNSDYFSVQKGEAFQSHFGLKDNLFTFSERDFSALKHLNH